MKKRDRRLTPSSTSLAGWDEAVDREATELKADTASAFYLDGEGTSGNKEKEKEKSLSKSESKDTARIISKQYQKTAKAVIEMKKIDKKKIKISKKNNYRVPVLYPDGKPGMPTTNKRANKWLKEKKAVVVKNKLNIFAIQLKFWPIYRNIQHMVILIDPGSTFTGMAVMSKKCINISYMLELPGYKRGSKSYIVEKIVKNGKEKGKIKKIETKNSKILSYHNTIVDKMTERRILRRGRRHRKCRRRECRFLNRSKKGKLAPSMLVKKQLELEIAKVLSKLYPIQIIGFEDVAFDHFKDVDGIKGQFFSQVEIGKNWLLDRLKRIIPDIRMIKGYETNRRRELLKLPKGKDKTKRLISSHVTDCIAMGSIILGLGIGISNKFKFNVVSRPKYSRRELFAKEPGKGGVFERAGGHIPNDKIFKGLRKGDYVEARLPVKKKIFRGWISGYTGDRIYISNFDWEQYPSVSVDNVRLLDRNHGIINLRLGWIKDNVDVCEFGTVQRAIDGGKMMKVDVKKLERLKIKKENEEFKKMDNMIQRSIEDAWE